MSTTLLFAAIAFTVGLVWGFRKPARYCSMSTEQRNGFGNRFGSGLINGIVLGIIAAAAAFAVFGA